MEKAPNPCGYISVTVCGGANLVSTDTNGLADPYVKLKWGKHTYTTEIWEESMHPAWNETFRLKLQHDTPSEDKCMVIIVMDHDSLKQDEVLGEMVVDFGTLKREEKAFASEQWYALRRTSKDGALLEAGNIKLKIFYSPTIDRSKAPGYEWDQPEETSASHFVPATSECESGEDDTDAQPSIARSAKDNTQQRRRAAPRAPLYFFRPANYGVRPAALHQSPYRPVLKVQHPVKPPVLSHNVVAEVPVASKAYHIDGGELIANLARLLPQCSVEQILEALRQTAYDQEKAYDLLLDGLLNAASKTQESQKLFSTAIMDMFRVSDNHSVMSPGNAGACCTPLSGTVMVQPCSNPDMMIPATGRRKVVLIGINYVGTREKLRGCVADVFRLRKLLTKVYGFLDDTDHLKVLVDDEYDQHDGIFEIPTKRNIMKAIEWLTYGAERGDVLVFQFSGHGSQKKSTTSHEVDGMDETILPVDWRQTGHIVDDELNYGLIRHLPEGVKLTAIMDCCHSGTGLDLPYAWNTQERKWDIHPNPFLTLADVQLIAGCRSDQTSADINSAATGSGGAMTFALVTSLSANPFKYSYPQLLKRIAKVLRSKGFKQLPQIESSQMFCTDRPFSFTDIHPNTNPYIGREGHRVKPIMRCVPRGLPGFDDSGEEDDQSTTGSNTPGNLAGGA